MIFQNFREPSDDVVDGMANAGRGKLGLAPNNRTERPLARMVCRDAQGPIQGEQELLNHVLTTVGASGYSFSRAFVVNYYVSLKANPFVILTGPEGRGKTELARLFAEALVGRSSPQYTLIPSAGSWTRATGQDHYYRSLQEQFSSGRFLDMLQEAADPSSIGKVYLVCFEALRAEELDYYFATLLQVGPKGEKRLNLPGFPLDRQPRIPPNVLITATVNTAEHRHQLSADVLRRAGLIEFRASGPLPAPAQPTSVPLPPPVGFQWLWLRSALHDVDQARARLTQILGRDQLGRLRSSPQLARLLWRAGEVLLTHTLHDLTTYIAHSFDEQGRGLFDPLDPQRNAQIAYDAQVVQRVLWRLRASPDDELRRDLADYLDAIALTETQQAVA